jgi:signal transduction histidine kinase
VAIRNWQRVEPYLVALACAAGAVLLRLPLEPILAGTLGWLTFWPAAFLAAWFGGARAGITTVLLSLIIVWQWLMPEADVATAARTAIGAVVFVVCTLGFAWVAETARRSRSAAEQLRQAAVDASRAKDEFLAVLGHELRNPLAPVASAAQLLRLRHPESRELDIIERQIKHMSRLVDDLLDVSRVVRGGLELQRSVTDLAALVEKAAEMVTPQRERSGHRFEIDVPAGLYVDVDAARVVQVLTNVLVNAMKFSTANEVIAIKAIGDRERVVLAIVDHGIGMDEAMLGRAFEPFVQGDQASDRAAGGLGLGLAISRRLVELHGGTLTATSVAGDGTTIEMALPRAEQLPQTTVATPAAAEQLPQTTVATPAAAEQLPQTTVATPAAVAPKLVLQRILVVDDNEDGAQMLAQLLEARGHEIKVAFDGEAALEVLQAFAPTLALVDIGLPGMDGHELARHMRERGVAARLIAVTGYGRESDRERALAAGFDDHLVKPVTLARLDEVIRNLT